MHPIRILTSHSSGQIFPYRAVTLAPASWYFQLDYHSPSKKSSKGKSGILASRSEEKKMTPVLEQTRLRKGKAGTSHSPAMKCLGLLGLEIMPAPKDASGTELTPDDLK